MIKDSLNVSRSPNPYSCSLEGPITSTTLLIGGVFWLYGILSGVIYRIVRIRTLIVRGSLTSLLLLLLRLLSLLSASRWSHHIHASHAMVVNHTLELLVGLKADINCKRVEDEKYYEEDCIKACETVIKRIIGFKTKLVIFNSILNKES